MRSALLALTLAALATLACKKEDTTAPTEGETTAASSESDATSSEPATETAAAEPDAELLETCMHMGKLMQADLAGTMEITDEQLAENAKTCAAELETKRAGMPAEQWQSERACVMAAQTVEAVTACG